MPDADGVNALRLRELIAEEDRIAEEIGAGSGIDLEPLRQKIDIPDFNPNGSAVAPSNNFLVDEADLDRVLLELATALGSTNHLFSRSGEVVKVELVVAPPMEDGPTHIAEVKSATTKTVRVAMSRVGNFFKYDNRAAEGRKWKEVAPPSGLAKTVLEEGATHLPPLQSVVAHPLLYQGKWVSGHGYHPETALAFACSEVPTEEFESPEEAVALIRDIMSPIPWCSCHAPKYRRHLRPVTCA